MYNKVPVREQDLCVITSNFQNSPPSLVQATFSQTFVAFALFSRGHSFHLYCCGNCFSIKFTFCIIKARLGGDFCQSDVITHKGYYLLEIKTSPRFEKFKGEVKLFNIIVLVTTIFNILLHQGKCNCFTLVPLFSRDRRSFGSLLSHICDCCSNLTIQSTCGLCLRSYLTGEREAEQKCLQHNHLKDYSSISYQHSLSIEEATIAPQRDNA